MYKLLIYKKAKDTLDDLKKYNLKYLDLLIINLDEIVLKWINSSNVKNIWDKIYRKRVWRWRILFTQDSNKNICEIWIIEIEKNTKKDYNKWKEYILYKLKTKLHK